MTPERGVRILAGTFVLLSLLLGAPASPLLVSPHFLWVTLFVGANLLQSGFTGFCPAELILKKIGLQDARRTQPSA